MKYCVNSVEDWKAEIQIPGREVISTTLAGFLANLPFFRIPKASDRAPSWGNSNAEVQKDPTWIITWR